jgi:hypothetical protein
MSGGVRNDSTDKVGRKRKEGANEEEERKRTLTLSHGDTKVTDSSAASGENKPLSVEGRTWVSREMQKGDRKEEKDAPRTDSATLDGGVDGRSTAHCGNGRKGVRNGSKRQRE